MIVSAVIYEDGTVGGPRSPVSGLLADRENEAAAAEKWQSALVDASRAPDIAAASQILQAVVDSGPSTERSSLSIRGVVVRALGQKQNEAAFKGFLSDGLRIANVHIAENRRHLTVGR